MEENKLNEARSRTQASLYMGLAINVFYILLELGMGLYARSAWFVALAVYFSLLAGMRYLLVRRGGEKRGPETELRRYRACGVLLLVMNQTLMGIVFLMVRYGRGFKYPGYFNYAMAAYAFYAVISAAVRLGKARRYDSPILSAARIIRFVAALVSILALETALIDQFGEPGEEQFRSVMTAATGAGVCLTVIIIAVYMIVKSTKALRALRKDAGQQ